MGDLRGDSVRYLWLSTPKKNNGASPGSPLHFVRQSSMNNRRTVLITEGALKAATVQTFKPELKVIALARISCSHNLVIQTTRHCPLLIAFDSDFHQNPQVVRHLANLINLRLTDSRNYGYAPDVKILSWSLKFKGIDDALLGGAPIEQKSIVHWLEALDSAFKDEAYKILKTRFIY